MDGTQPKHDVYLVSQSNARLERTRHVQNVQVYERDDGDASHNRAEFSSKSNSTTAKLLAEGTAASVSHDTIQKQHRLRLIPSRPPDSITSPSDEIERKALIYLENFIIFYIIFYKLTIN